MTRSGPIGRALAAALKDASLPPRDGAAVAMLKRYAVHLDEAQALADAVDLLEPEDESQERRIQALRLKLDAQSVASDFGPKFEKLLTALGMTLAGRATKTTKDSNESRSDAAALDELRARRATRSHRAASVDSAAP